MSQNLDLDGAAVPTICDLASLVPHAAARWPDDVAVIGDGARWAWGDVERRTRNLAGRLLAAGVVRGDRVAVAHTKAAESFEAVHAVLRAGAVVVPVDAAAPPAVAEEVLSDAAAVAVLGDAPTIAKFDVWTILPELRVVLATGSSDDPRVVPWELAANDDTPTELPAVDPDDLAYFIYTSGTTGRPKGIVHTHRSGMEYVRTAAAVHGIRRDDRIAGMCPLHFDMSTLELYVAPFAGARVVVVGDALMRLFLAEFSELTERERITVWYGVPFFFRQLVERGALDRYDLSSLRFIGYGGRALPARSAPRADAPRPARGDLERVRPGRDERRHHTRRHRAAERRWARSDRTAVADDRDPADRHRRLRRARTGHGRALAVVDARDARVLAAPRAHRRTPDPESRWAVVVCHW